MPIKYFKEIETDKNLKTFDGTQFVSVYEKVPIQSIVETFSKTSGKPYIVTKCLFTNSMKFSSDNTYDKRCINNFKKGYTLIKKENSDNQVYIVKNDNFESITSSSLFTVKVVDKIDPNTYNVEIFSIGSNKFVHVGQIEIEDDFFFF